jgi:hypothetical protein
MGISLNSPNLLIFLEGLIHCPGVDQEFYLQETSVAIVGGLLKTRLYYSQGGLKVSASDQLLNPSGQICGLTGARSKKHQQ